MFILLLTLVLLYALAATIAAVSVAGYLHMGGPNWQTFLCPVLFFVLSYASVWFTKSRATAIWGAIINLSIILSLRPFNVSLISCFVYSALWFGAAWNLARTRRT